MGITLFCSESCYCWIKKLSTVHRNLRALYRQPDQYGEYAEVALQVLKNYQNVALQNVQQQSLRKSLIDSTHYQRDGIGVFGSQEDNSPPKTLQSLTASQKQKHLRKLIKDSCILVDLSDIFEGNCRKTYQKQIKDQIFNNQNYLIESMALSSDIDLMIKQFNPTVISLLQDYVNFCNQIRQQFQYQSQTFYTKLLLNLKAQIMKKYQNITVDNNLPQRQLYRQLQKFKKQIQIICKLLVDTVCIQINKKLHYPNIDHSQNISFYQEVNLHTLMMSILFSDDKFFQFVQRIFQRYLFNWLKKYKNRNYYQNSQLIKSLKNVNNEGKKIKKNKKQLIIARDINGKSINLNQLFQSRSQNNINAIKKQKLKIDKFFQKSLLMFNTILDKTQPISKLKIFYQLNKQIYKQFLQIFKNRQQQNIPFTRQSSSIIATWIINKQKNNSQRYLLNILITYSFIHQRYRQSQKGSCLIPFVQEVQRIIQCNQ